MKQGKDMTTQKYIHSAVAQKFLGGLREGFLVFKKQCLNWSWIEDMKKSRPC